jgi:hypothetical protein
MSVALPIAANWAADVADKSKTDTEVVNSTSALLAVLILVDSLNFEALWNGISASFALRRIAPMLSAARLLFTCRLE